MKKQKERNLRVFICFFEHQRCLWLCVCVCVLSLVSFSTCKSANTHTRNIHEIRIRFLLLFVDGKSFIIIHTWIMSSKEAMYFSEQERQQQPAFIQWSCNLGLSWEVPTTTTTTTTRGMFIGIILSLLLLFALVFFRFFRYSLHATLSRPRLSRKMLRRLAKKQNTPHFRHDNLLLSLITCDYAYNNVDVAVCLLIV